MGSCFSVQHTAASSALPKAKVVTASGHLLEYSAPVTASHALLHLEPVPASAFLCSSDRLFFDEPIPALLPDELLQMGQIYFSLPERMLRQPLSAADMAALAGRASGALAEAEVSEGGRKRGWKKKKKKLRISPILDVDLVGGGADFFVAASEKRVAKAAEGAASERFAKSRSVRKLQKSASKRARMAVRSFRMRLSTINEGTVSVGF